MEWQIRQLVQFIDSKNWQLVQFIWQLVGLFIPLAEWNGPPQIEIEIVFWGVNGFLVNGFADPTDKHLSSWCCR